MADHQTMGVPLADIYNAPLAGSPSAGSESAYGDDEMEREQVRFNIRFIKKIK